jgi:hypothetical protein
MELHCYSSKMPQADDGGSLVTEAPKGKNGISRSKRLQIVVQTEIHGYIRKAVLLAI